MKIEDISTRKLKALLTHQKQTAPGSEAIQDFERELMRRELQTKEESYFLSIEEAAVFLGITPDELEADCANNALAYSYVPDKGFTFDIRKISPLIPAESFEAAWERVKKIRDASKDKATS